MPEEAGDEQEMPPPYAAAPKVIDNRGKTKADTLHSGRPEADKWEKRVYRSKPFREGILFKLMSWVARKSVPMASNNLRKGRSRATLFHTTNFFSICSPEETSFVRVSFIFLL